MCNEIDMDSERQRSVTSMIERDRLETNPRVRDTNIATETLNSVALTGPSFRKTLGLFPTGVTVIAGIDPNGARFGATVSTFTSVSLDPPLILFCLTSGSETLAQLLQSGQCAINFLSEDQEDISQIFAERKIDWTKPKLENADGMPRLAGCLAYLEGDVHASYPGGDHEIVVIQIKKALVRGGRPLIHHRSAYSRLIDVWPEREEP